MMRPQRKSKLTPTPAGRPRANRDAIRVLKEWGAEPPLHDRAFWRDLDEELRRERLTLRKPS